MGIRKTTQRDERRRRVLVEERILTPSRQEPAHPSNNAPSSRRTRRYADAALINRQPRICSLVPTRPWTVSIWFLAGLAFVMAHATTFALMVRYVPADLPIDLAPVHLTGPRALANWSASLMLIFAAVLSALIVQFRQHRIDDYRGEYRVWYYVIFGMVVASINASIGGHEILFQAARHAAATYEIPRASLWINGMLSICVTGVCVRLLLEVRSSRGTVVTGLLSGAAYLGHLLLKSGIWRVPTADLQALTIGLARLAGHYLLVMSLAIYARYVVLDAQGLISQAARKKKKTSEKKSTAKANSDEPATSESPSSPTRVRQESKPRPTPSVRIQQAASSRDQDSRPEPVRDANSAAQRSSQQDGDTDLGSEEGPATLKMSKSERRRQRKQKRRERRAA
jgi:hypothetical protein